MIIHLYDGTGWTCDVPCTDEQWALYKRTARKEHMKLADWLMMAIKEGVAALMPELGDGGEPDVVNPPSGESQEEK